MFVHVATLGRYQQILDETLSSLKGSALFPALDLISVNVVGDGPVHLGLSDPRVELHRRSDTVTVFEHPTLEAIHRHAQASPRARLLYLNGLGGRYQGADFDNRAQWRRMLYFLLIERSGHVLSLLRECDVCGVQWTDRPMPHMTSNNWWANAAYLARLPDPTTARDAVVAQDLHRFGGHWAHEDVRRRHAGEFWVGMGRQCRPHSLYPLDGLGLPLSQYGVVPWWELRHVPWEHLARQQVAVGAGAAVRLPWGQRAPLLVSYRAKQAWRSLRLIVRRGLTARQPRSLP